MGKRLRVAIDLDGILRNLWPQIDKQLRHVGLVGPEIPKISPPRWEMWEHYRLTREMFYEFLYDSESSRTIFMDAGMYEDAFLALRKFEQFRDQGIEFGIVTTQTQRTMAYTWEWVYANHLTKIFLSIDCLVAGTDRTKADFGYDVLLDDRPANVAAFQQQFGIGVAPHAWVYDQTWNRDVALPRVFNFDEFFEYLQGFLCV